MAIWNRTQPEPTPLYINPNAGSAHTHGVIGGQTHDMIDDQTAATNPSQQSGAAQYNRAFYTEEEHLRRAVFSRLSPDFRDGSVLQHMPFGRLEVAKLAPERYVVWVIANGESITIEDGALFPSDTLITQLRLLAAGKK